MVLTLSYAIFSSDSAGNSFTAEGGFVATVYSFGYLLEYTKFREKE